MRVWIMRTGISVVVSPSDRLRLEAVVGDRNTRQKHVWRCRIVLLTADGAGTSTIMRVAGVSKTAVWRWQERFMASGVDGLLRDNAKPKPFTWNADPDKIIAAVKRGHQALDSIH